MHECKKCPYFAKEEKNQLTGGRVIVGTCKIRGKRIPWQKSVNLERGFSFDTNASCIA